MPNYCSCDQSGSGGGVVLEGRRNLLLGLVVASKTMNTRLNQDETEFGVLVLAVDLEVLAHGHRLFDEVPKVLWDGRCQSYPQTKRHVQKYDAAAKVRDNKADSGSVHECLVQ